VGAFFVILILLIGAGVAYGSYWLKKKRRDELATFATQYQLSYSKEDPFGLLITYPYELFARGDGRGCENVLSGTWQGLTVKETDYWYYDESTDSKGNRTKTYHHFSALIVDLPLRAPYLTVAKENILTTLADHVGLKDIDFESEQFNREFNVKCHDREFAFKLIDARMEQFLLDTGGAYSIEFAGSSALIYCKRLPPTGLVPLFGTAKGFVDHIPRLVWNEYGPGGGGPAGLAPPEGVEPSPPAQPAGA
jgi:hypothetical protein